MSNYITNAQDIIESTSMIEVLQEMDVEINSNGKCKCPVHDGEKYNFQINEDYGYCHSQCAKSWDVVSIVMDVKNITYIEALEFVAKINSIQLKYDGDKDRGNLIFEAKKKKKKLKEIIELNKTVSEHYVKNFGDRLELNGREFSKEVLELFEIGISDSKSQLSKLAQKHNYEDSLLLDVGLIKSNEGKTYDFFRNRIMFPIHDQNGNIAGFSGRQIKRNSKYPKYINSSESISYEKKKLLYGLYHSRKSIYKKDFAYIVEGYTDVIGMHDNDLGNVVATGGTALTFNQAKVISRYTKYVVMLMDGDEVGQKAMLRNVDVLLKAQLKVSVCILPDKEDPESYLRENGKDEFISYSSTNTDDGLIWKVERELINDDPFQREKAIKIASRLISIIDSKHTRDQYINKLFRSLQISKLDLKNLVKEDQEKLVKHKKSTLSNEQKSDISYYGIYSLKNKYFASRDLENGIGHEISNFIVKPIMLVMGSDRSSRLVEIINERGQSFIKDIDSDDFVDLGRFKRQVERMGNFVFKGKEDVYLKVKSKVYNDMPAAHMITTLGQHKQGFWAWSNGLTYNKEFHPVDEYGLVDYEATKYYLPAFSKIHLDVKSDDQYNTYEDDKLFSYIKRKNMKTLNEWMLDMFTLYGDNGIIGSTYYLASIYRDIVYQRFNFFPHLNLFGPSGSGKSYLCWSIVALLGKPRMPFNLAQGTNVGFYRRLAQTRNGLVWYDEYSNDVDFKRIEALKAAYDGAGHEKGIKSQNNRTVTTKVNSAVLISGQQQPIKDIALFKRCISLNFKTGSFTDKQKKTGDELKAIESTGALSTITSDLHQYRSLIKEKFDQEFDKIRVEITAMLPPSAMIEDRIMNNYVIPLTIYKILEGELKLPYEYPVLKTLFTHQIVEQSKAIFKEDELAVWWNQIQFMVETDKLLHNYDLIVQDLINVKVLVNNSTVDKQFDGPKKILFLRIAKAHPLYMENHKKQYGKGGMPKQSLVHYLQSSKAYLGFMKNKKFDKKNYSCYLFDLEMTGMEIPDTPFQKLSSNEE